MSSERCKVNYAVNVRLNMPLWVAIPAVGLCLRYPKHAYVNDIMGYCLPCCLTMNNKCGIIIFTIRHNLFNGGQRK